MNEQKKKRKKERKSIEREFGRKQKYIWWIKLNAVNIKTVKVTLREENSRNKKRWRKWKTKKWKKKIKYKKWNERKEAAICKLLNRVYFWFLCLMAYQLHGLFNAIAINV